MKEPEYLFDAQWKNGMIPHIVFNEKEKTYFPTADFYEITSGTSGLVTIFHPWETGRDDSPVWDDALSRISITDLPKFKRLDVIAVDGAIDTIPSNAEYDKFIYLIDLMKLYNYDEKIMYEKFPFKIKDVSFNGILYVANKILLRIGGLIGEDSREISEWISWTERNFQKFFFTPLEWRSNVSDGLFYDYDLVISERIIKRTVSFHSPIYTGLVSNREADAIVRWISNAE